MATNKKLALKSLLKTMTRSNMTTQSKEKPIIKDFQKYQDLLLSRKQRIINEIQSRSIEQVDYEPGDIADQATELLEQEMSLSFTEAERSQLHEIDEALNRIKDKTYGICEDSGEIISTARLDAVPEARRTLVAQEKYDKKIIKARRFRGK